MNLVIPAPAPTLLPVAGGGLFPVHRIYCVGRNSAEHAQEMGFSGREPPFFFLKPADAAVPAAEGETGTIDYPSLTSNFHHEVTSRFPSNRAVEPGSRQHIKDPYGIWR